MVPWLTGLTAQPKRPHNTFSKYFQHQLINYCRLSGIMGTFLFRLVLWWLSSCRSFSWGISLLHSCDSYQVSSTFWHFKGASWCQLLCFSLAHSYQSRSWEASLRYGSVLDAVFLFFWRKDKTFDKTGRGTTVPRATTVPHHAGRNLVWRRLA